MKNIGFRLIVSAFLIFNGLFVCQVAAATQIDIPGPAGSVRFGTQVTALPNGNIVVTDPNFNLAGVANVGAVYLYNGATGALISRLTGSTTSDAVGENGITLLPNGNYVVRSQSWNNRVGAVTFCNGTTGCTGAVSSANSLTGSTALDRVGEQRITILANGNYVVSSPNWSNGGINAAGAATFCSGTTGCTGVITSANSLVGSSADDKVSGIPGVIPEGITALTNGNYVVNSPFWNNGAITDVGAATFCNGTAGCTGAVSAANSLIGSQINDQVSIGGTGGQVSFRGTTALTNGNYVVNSPVWDNGAIFNAGAATFCNGTSGCTGAVSTANSLIGSSSGESAGGVTALTNGNYVAHNRFWRNGSAPVGAVRWCNGTTGCVGEFSPANSLIGSQSGDYVGYFMTALTNGNYVVNSPY